VARFIAFRQDFDHQAAFGTSAADISGQIITTFEALVFPSSPEDFSSLQKLPEHRRHQRDHRRVLQSGPDLRIAVQVTGCRQKRLLNGKEACDFSV
jgi:hypothetical protein